MLRDALNFPPSGKHGSRAVVIGGALLGLLTVVVGVASFLIGRRLSETGIQDLSAVDVWAHLPVILGVFVCCFCVWLLVGGYFVAVLRVVVGDAEPTPPAFRPRVVVDGVKAAVILGCYLVPAVVLGGVGLVFQQPACQTKLCWLPSAVGAFAFLFGLFALVGAAYLVPAATALFATRRSVWAAFDRSALWNCVISEDYAVGWVFATVIQIVLFPVTIVLQTVLVGFFLQFYLLVSVQHVYGLSVANALGRGDEL